MEKFLGVLRKNLDEMGARANSTNSSTSSEPSPVQTVPAALDETSISQSTTGSQSKDGKPPKDQELIDRRTEFGLAWIVYMRFARRAEGIKAARTVFGKARRDHWTPWEVYEAAGMFALYHVLLFPATYSLLLALMEYHCSKAVDVAGRIFERGMENFPDEVELALRYLGFLISINDDASKSTRHAMRLLVDDTTRCACSFRACC